MLLKREIVKRKGGGVEKSEGVKRASVCPGGSNYRGGRTSSGRKKESLRGQNGQRERGCKNAWP